MPECDLVPSRRRQEMVSSRCNTDQTDFWDDGQGQQRTHLLLAGW